MARRALNSSSSPRRFLRVDLLQTKSSDEADFDFIQKVFNYSFRIRWLQDVPGTLHNLSYIPDAWKWGCWWAMQNFREISTW